MKQREIKFRAWDFRAKKWIDLNKDLAIDPTTGDLLYANDTDDLCIVDWLKYELTQFTGLTDKNGKKIYEGDILATDNDGKDGADAWEREIMGPVRWDDEHAMFIGVGDNDDDSIYGPQYVFIIGNIYENPELLNR